MSDEQAIKDAMKRLALKVQEKPQEEYKFWKTQPVIKIGEKVEAGINEAIEPDLKPEQVSKEPVPLPKELEWAELDFDHAETMDEVQKFVSEYYVEDDDSMFRFHYSIPLIRWALQIPGAKKSWQLGIRVKSNQKMVAMISAIPSTMYIYQKPVKMVLINFLCIHKKLRSKRLATLLIKEITRRSNLEGVFQAIYSGASYLPTPITILRYFHRLINIKKLVDVKFSYIKKKMTLARTIKLHKLPDEPQTPGFRPIQESDLKQVFALHKEYIKQFDCVRAFEEEEAKYSFMSYEGAFHGFVVENPENKKIEGFCGYYMLDYTLLRSAEYDRLHAGYIWHYAATSDELLKSMMKDLITSAKNNGIDVINALNIMKHEEFFKDLLFVEGDGKLHLYLYNWKCPPIEHDKQAFLIV